MKGVRMSFIETYQWEIFITLEVLSWVSLILFGLLRYFFNQRKKSMVFLVLFVALIGMEALFGWFMYLETGEMSTIQLVITVFVLYAITFGFSDFKKLDRWMRKYIGKWRGIDLLTDQDKLIMRRNEDPRYIARKYRRSSMIHLLIFVSVQIGFWMYSLSSFEEALPYIKDLSWLGADDYTITPYANDTLYGISLIWGFAFIVDFIYSWSYTLFPSDKSD